MKNKTIIALYIFLMVINMFNFVRSEINISDPAYIEVLNALNNSEWVRVIIEVNKSLDQDIESIKLEILSNLSEDEFEFKGTIEGRNWVSGYLTSKGLEKLKFNKNILEIKKEMSGGIALHQSVPLINATIVWSKGYSGKGQTICVIDSGVNSGHPDLQGKVLAEYCYCSYPEGNLSDCCPDGTAEDNNAEDNHGHGTHVTGIIVSQDSTYMGVAPNSSVVVVKVTNSSGNWADSDLAKGVHWCNSSKETYNISVITISLGSLPPYLYNNTNICEIDWYSDEEINSANFSGIFVDASSGNDNNKNKKINYIE